MIKTNIKLNHHLAKDLINSFLHNLKQQSMKLYPNATNQLYELYDSWMNEGKLITDDDLTNVVFSNMSEGYSLSVTLHDDYDEYELRKLLQQAWEAGYLAATPHTENLKRES